MKIYIENTEKLSREISPDITVDCSLLSHRQILLAIADGLGLEPPSRATLQETAQYIASRPPYRRILIQHVDRAPLRLAYSLLVIAQRHYLFLHADRTTGGAVGALRAAGVRIETRGVQWRTIGHAALYLGLLALIGATVAAPSWLRREYGFDIGIAGLVVVYIARKYLWRAVWHM